MGQCVHLRNFLKIDACTVEAICDLRVGVAAKVAEKFHIPKACGSIDELLALEGLDAVAAIVHFSHNPTVAVSILGAGHSLYIEKPMALDPEDARKMVAAKADDAVFMVAYMKRYDPGVEFAKRFIDEHRQSGELGKITFARSYCFRGDWVCGYDEPMVTGADPVARSRVGEGVPSFVNPEDHQMYMTSVSYYCHDVNLMRYLLGEPADVASSRRFGSQYSTIFDYGDYDCVFEASPMQKCHFEQGIRVNFEEGWIEVKTPAPLHVNKPADVLICRRGSIEVPAIPWGWSFRREAEYFLHCVAEGKEPRSSGADSLKDIELFETMYRQFRQHG